MAKQTHEKKGCNDNQGVVGIVHATDDDKEPVDNAARMREAIRVSEEKREADDELLRAAQAVIQKPPGAEKAPLTEKQQGLITELLDEKPDWIKIVAKRYFIKENRLRFDNNDFEELLSAMREGLCRAAQTFDESRNCKFQTYASKCAINAGWSEIRDRLGSTVGRMVTFTKIGFTGNTPGHPWDFIADWRPGPEETASRRCVRSAASENCALRGLKKKTQTMLRMRLRGYTIKETADSFGCTILTVKRKLQMAYGVLRAKFEGREDDLLPMFERQESAFVAWSGKAKASATELRALSSLYRLRKYRGKQKKLTPRKDL